MAQPSGRDDSQETTLANSAVAGNRTAVFSVYYAGPLFLGILL
jgi:hypothetical protein